MLPTLRASPNQIKGGITHPNSQRKKHKNENCISNMEPARQKSNRLVDAEIQGQLISCEREDQIIHTALEEAKF